MAGAVNAAALALQSIGGRVSGGEILAQDTVLDIVEQTTIGVSQLRRGAGEVQ